MIAETTVWIVVAILFITLTFPLLLLATHVERLSMRVKNLEEHMLARRSPWR